MRRRLAAGCGKVGASLAVLALVAAAPSPSAAQSKDPIKIGFVTEMSGPWSFFGTACEQGMRLAEQRVNAAGGALGRPLDFVVSDDQTNPTQAAAAARSLDVQSNVLALSGPTSSDTALAIYGYAEQNKVPFVVPIAAFPQLTKPGTHYTFRIEPDAVGWGYAIDKFIAERKPGARIAIMYSDFALMRAIAAGLKYEAPRSKIDVVSEVVFPQGSNDATVQAAQVVAAKPDYVVVFAAGAFDNTVTLQLLDLGLKPEQIVHPYGSTNSMFGWTSRSVGSAYGTFFDANLDNLTQEGHDFVKAFTAKVGRIPSYAENYCYITPYIIKAAIDKAGAVDREKFRNAMSELKMTEPTDGIPIEFDKNGARKEYMYFMQIESIAKNSYTAKKLFYTEWDPEVIPVYQLVK